VEDAARKAIADDGRADGAFSNSSGHRATLLPHALSLNGP
jgi:hypothetical protein